MASNDVETISCDDSKRECGETFNFEQWIEANELSPVKSLMIKHNLNTIDTLSLRSPKYFQLLSDSDLLETKSNFIPKIHKAINSLDGYIVVFEAENCAMGKLKQHIVDLDKIQKNMRQLKEKYPKSIQKINKERDSQIKQAQKKINDTFDNIKDELNKRQQHLLDELIKMKEGNINVDDMKEIELFDEVEHAVKIERNKIDDNLKLCNDTVVTQRNKDIEKRKEFILNVEEKCSKEFNLKMQNMTKSEQRMQELITKHNEYCIKIAFNINKGKYNNLLKRINNLGIIENSENSDQTKETKQEILDYSVGFAITDDHDLSQDSDMNSSNIKREDMQKKIKELYDTINQWQQKYDTLLNALNVDTTNKCKLFDKKCRNLVNSIASCKHKYERIVKEYKTLKGECDKLGASNMNLQQEYNNLQASNRRLAKQTTEWEQKYHGAKESHKCQINQTAQWQRKYNNLNKTHKRAIIETVKWKQKYDDKIKSGEHHIRLESSPKKKNQSPKWKRKYNDLKKTHEHQVRQTAEWKHKYDGLKKSIVKSLGFSYVSDFRWCKEEKEQYIPVKIINSNPKTYVSEQGILKYANEVRCQILNTIDPQQICKWISVMRQSFEIVKKDSNWTFDCWDNNLKHDNIDVLYMIDIVKTTSNLFWFRSVFASKICKSPFKYHWKLEQQSESPTNFYVGIERVGEETVDTYFCKSSTSYGFSGHDAKLYSNGTSGDDYGECCSKKGDKIDVYLDLGKYELSYGVNGKIYEKAYDVKPGQYKLAISMNGISQIKMMYSTIRE